MIHEILDCVLFSNFVSPILCKQLEDAGMPRTTLYHWRVREGETKLSTSVFDYDAYYIDARNLIDLANPPEHQICAYSIKDIERVLPSFRLSRENEGFYYVSLYDTKSESGDWIIKAHQRMPDAFAIGLLEGISRGIINVQSIEINL